jgi:hypothetical protein
MWIPRLPGETDISVGEVSTGMRQSGALTTIEAGKLVDKGLPDAARDLKARR